MVVCEKARIRQQYKHYKINCVQNDGYPPRSNETRSVVEPTGEVREFLVVTVPEKDARGTSFLQVIDCTCGGSGGPVHWVCADYFDAST